MESIFPFVGNVLKENYFCLLYKRLILQHGFFFNKLAALPFPHCRFSILHFPHTCESFLNMHLKKTFVSLYSELSHYFF